MTRKGENRSKALSRRRAQDPLDVLSCKDCRMPQKVDRHSGRCPQCTAAEADTPSSEDTGSSTDSDKESFIYEIDRKSIERSQLLSTFLGSYFPSNVEPEVWLARHMSPLLVLPDIDLSSPMMSSAVDTLCLAHLGSTRHDQRLLHESQNAYGRVLHAIMQAISGKTTHAFNPREVIASCLLMSVYDDGIPGRFKSQNYATHLFGAAQYAQACGPSCLDPAQPFDQKLLMWVRFQSLFVCVARRKRYFWSRPEWRAMEEKFPSGGQRDWYPLLVPLPGLLETSDKYLRQQQSDPKRIQQAFKLCRELDQFREKLFDWVNNDFAGWPGIAAVTDLDAFDMEIEEHCFMTTSPTFTTFHVFLDAAHAMRCVVSWFLALVSDCTLLRLLAAYPGAEAEVGRTIKQVEQKAYLAATEVCRSVYYYSILNSLAYAHLLLVWVDLAQVFFEEFGAMKEMGWCQACLIATKMRIDRVKPIRRGTLCRVGDLFGAFTKACRYRTRPVPTAKELHILCPEPT